MPDFGRISLGDMLTNAERRLSLDEYLNSRTSPTISQAASWPSAQDALSQLEGGLSQVNGLLDERIREISEALERANASTQRAMGTRMRAAYRADALIPQRYDWVPDPEAAFVPNSAYRAVEARPAATPQPRPTRQTDVRQPFTKHQRRALSDKLREAHRSTMSVEQRVGFELALQSIASAIAQHTAGFDVAEFYENSREQQT